MELEIKGMDDLGRVQIPKELREEMFGTSDNAGQDFIVELLECADGKRVFLLTPKEKEIQKIYVFGVIDDDGVIKGYAVDKIVVCDGVPKMNLLVSRRVPNIQFCKAWMGVNSEHGRLEYDRVYPDGYELVWLGCFGDHRIPLTLISGKLPR